MIRILAGLVLSFSLWFNATAQQPAPQLLKEPANWAFERFQLPPVFAPSFPYRGVEELRFSPGMFDKGSTNYFTYAFAAQLDSTSSMPADSIRDYLLTYFKGLCNGTANDRKLVIDTSKITVSVKKKKVAPETEIYNALLNIFGVFADGAPIKLNMEIKVLPYARIKKTYLIFIASPREKTDSVWKQLYKIQQDFTVPAGLDK